MVRLDARNFVFLYQIFKYSFIYFIFIRSPGNILRIFVVLSLILITSTISNNIIVLYLCIKFVYEFFLHIRSVFFRNFGKDSIHHLLFFQDRNGTFIFIRLPLRYFVTLSYLSRTSIDRKYDNNKNGMHGYGERLSYFCSSSSSIPNTVPTSILYRYRYLLQYFVSISHRFRYPYIIVDSFFNR